jgi:hypothetical protein
MFNTTEIITHEYCEECNAYTIELSYDTMVKAKDLNVDYEFDGMNVHNDGKSATIYYKVTYEGYIRCPECKTLNSTVGETTTTEEAK